jgi:Nicotinamide mononucleotide transporter.
VVSWWLWIVLDCLYVGLFLFKDLRLTAALYAGFVLLAVYGLRAWQQDLAHQEQQPATDIDAFADGSTAGDPIR